MDGAARAAPRSLARSRRIQAIGANGACQFRFAVRTRPQLDLDPRLLPFVLVAESHPIDLDAVGRRKRLCYHQTGRCDFGRPRKNRPKADDTDRIMMLRTAVASPKGVRASRPTSLALKRSAYVAKPQPQPVAFDIFLDGTTELVNSKKITGPQTRPPRSALAEVPRRVEIRDDSEDVHLLPKSMVRGCPRRYNLAQRIGG
jgi:hypothetical protein